MATKKLSEEDRSFVMQARPTEIAEIKLGQLARERASHRDVKVFAESLAIDHANTEQQLMRLVSDSDVQPPNRMDPEHEGIERRLRTLEGASFDEEYLRIQAQDHQRLIALFSHESDEGEDEELADFAQRCIPLLQRHLRNVRDLASSLPNLRR